MSYRRTRRIRAKMSGVSRRANRRAKRSGFGSKW